MKLSLLFQTVAFSVLLCGCASYQYVSSQPDVEGRVISTKSIEGNLFYDSLVTAVKAEHPWDTKKLLSYGKPDFIYSEGINNCYLLYKNPQKIIYMDAPLVGKIKFTELDFIPDDFIAYMEPTTQATPPTSTENTFNQKLAQLELGMSETDFLKLFPEASILSAKIDTYENTDEAYQRKDYSCNWWGFTFADGKLNSYQSMLAK